MKILIVSDLSIYAIAHSFIRALKEEGHEVLVFDVQSAAEKYVKLGKIGRTIHAFWPVETWTRKGNRELAVFFQKNLPNHVIVSGSAPVMFSTLAFWKSIAPATTVSLFWPDTLTNLQQLQLNGARLYDAVASYSKATLPVFTQMGFSKAIWLPFAGDTAFLGTEKPPAADDHFDYDLTFIGGWRPEREGALVALIRAFPQLTFSIRGGYWAERVKEKSLKSYVHSGSLYGMSFGQFLRTSRINLNVIDDTNYPAANMRFFEVPAAGGLQLSSSCPEQEDIFRDKEHIYYFKDEKELCDKVSFILDNPSEAFRVRQNGFNLIGSTHNYRERMKMLFGELNG